MCDGRAAARAVLLLLALFPSFILGHVFDRSYADHPSVLSLFSMQSMMTYFLMVLTAALSARRMTRDIFLGSIVCAVVAVATSWPLIHLMGMPGVIACMMVGNDRHVGVPYLSLSASHESSRQCKCRGVQARGARMCELMEMPIAAPDADPRRKLLAGIFRALNDSGVPWCIVHGYEKFADEAPTDIDCLLGAELTPRKLAELFKSQESELNARVVQWLNDGAQWIVLASNDPVPTMLQLHVSYDYELGRRIFYRGSEDSRERRQPREDFWIASVKMEFGCVLANRISKAKLDPRRQERLAALFEQDAQGCVRQIARSFNPENARAVSMAVRTNDWDEVVGDIEPMRGDLLKQCKKTDVIRPWLRRVKRWLRPDCGLHVVFLGPDGVGKSTVIEAVKENLSAMRFCERIISRSPHR